MRESNFKWVNSNMPLFRLPLDCSDKVSEFEVVTVTSADGSHTRRVGLIGLCGEDRSVLKKGAFGDVPIESVPQTCRK